MFAFRDLKLSIRNPLRQIRGGGKVKGSMETVTVLDLIDKANRVKAFTLIPYRIWARNSGVNNFYPNLCFCSESNRQIGWRA